ncbi:UNVERIFIED_CONTAM: hypothetical protein Sradi_6441100 [Sesamum radiatum]|uniref:Uncharacterized protein n=1 Tax=Sesamum radiatum TaxID=300843 RepID=A0AAW2K6Y6_SESRA
MTVHFLRSFGFFFASKFRIILPQTNDITLFCQAWKRNNSRQLHVRDIFPFLILWHIWTRRNTAKHRGFTFKADSVIFKILEHLHLIKKCGLWKPFHWKGDLCTAGLMGIQIFPPAKKTRGIVVTSKKPLEGWTKVNMDGAARGNPGAAGGGGVLRNHLGKSSSPIRNLWELSTALMLNCLLSTEVSSYVRNEA